MDLCIVEVDLVDDELVYAYGCYAIPGHFVTSRERCLLGYTQEHASILCCENEDRCNEHLHPRPPTFYMNRTTATTTTTLITSSVGAGTGMGLEQVWDWAVIKVFHTFQCDKRIILIGVGTMGALGTGAPLCF